MYNGRYEQMGLDPMPVYSPPSKVDKNRFRLIIGLNAVFTHASTQNNTLLHEMIPEITLWIHPAAADRLGIRSGDRVEVSSGAGRGELKAEVTPKIREDSVYMLSGFGTLSKGLSLIAGKGASIAEILESRYDEVSGNAAMHETLVSVVRKEAS